LIDMAVVGQRGKRAYFFTDQIGKIAYYSGIVANGSLAQERIKAQPFLDASPVRANVEKAIQQTGKSIGLRSPPKRKILRQLD